MPSVSQPPAPQTGSTICLLSGSSRHAIELQRANLHPTDTRWPATTFTSALTGRRSRLAGPRGAPRFCVLNRRQPKPQSAPGRHDRDAGAVSPNRSDPIAARPGSLRTVRHTRCRSPPTGWGRTPCHQLRSGTSRRTSIARSRGRWGRDPRRPRQVTTRVESCQNLTEGSVLTGPVHRSGNSLRDATG